MGKLVIIGENQVESLLGLFFFSAFATKCNCGIVLFLYAFFKCLKNSIRLTLKTKPFCAHVLSKRAKYRQTNY